MAKPTAWELFWARVEPDGDCWIWSGRLIETGYGRYGGRLAHRTAYEWLVGPVPEGLQLDHLCRRRACCNPDHLEPVTLAENVRRGRLTKQRYCKHGHEWTPANTKWRFRRTWTRHCRACHRAQERARYAARRLHPDE